MFITPATSKIRKILPGSTQVDHRFQDSEKRKGTKRNSWLALNVTDSAKDFLRNIIEQGEFRGRKKYSKKLTGKAQRVTITTQIIPTRRKKRWEDLPSATAGAM